MLQKRESRKWGIYRALSGAFQQSEFACPSARMSQPTCGKSLLCSPSLRLPLNVINIILFPYETCPPKDPTLPSDQTRPNRSSLIPCLPNQSSNEKRPPIPLNPRRRHLRIHISGINRSRTHRTHRSQRRRRILRNRTRHRRRRRQSSRSVVARRVDFVPDTGRDVILLVWY
jgi:hypothetical protein